MELPNPAPLAAVAAETGTTDTNAQWCAIPTELAGCTVAGAAVGPGCSCQAHGKTLAGTRIANPNAIYFPSVVAEGTIIPVFFATDRRVRGTRSVTTVPGTTAQALMFGAEWTPQPTYGVANVSIPSSHVSGDLERPFRVLFIGRRENPEKDVVLRSSAELSAEEFLRVVSARVRATAKKQALVFIHGFNVPFDDAVRRTAQVAYDLKYPGPPILFSWPSFGEESAYVADGQNAQLAAPHLRSLLSDIAERTGAEETIVIAHSMGNQVLAAALNGIPESARKTMFKEIILAAPDIDVRLFEQLSNAFRATSRRITLYASDRDRALQLSSRIVRYQRLGYASPVAMVAPGMDTIDASAVDTSLLGHSYYGGNGTVLRDIAAVVATTVPVDQRQGISPFSLGGRRYWRFTAPPDE